jgi:hypothetical protein
MSDRTHPSATTGKESVMQSGLIRHIAAGVVVAMVAVGCYRKVYIYEYSDGRRIESNFPLNQNPQIEIADLRPSDADANIFTGQWRGENLEAARDDRSLMLKAVSDDGRRRSGTSVASREIVGNPTGASFELKREAGTLKFDRTTDAGGSVTLTMDPAYLAAIAEATGGHALSAEQKLTLFRSGLGLEYVRAIKEAGYKVMLDELLELRNNGVTAEYLVGLRKAGYDFKPAQVINLSRNGITRDYAVALREAGFVLGDEQLIKLSRNGIGRDYARDMKEAGYGNIDDIIELSRNGVGRAYARQMGLGGKRPAKSVIEMNRNGVSPSFGESMTKLGYEFSDDDLVKLGRNGVGASFAKSILEAGYKFSADELIELSRNGVSSDYARKVKQAGYNLTAADLVTLSRNGVSSSFMVSLHDPNKPNLSVDAIVDLSRRGVDAATVKKIRGM